MGIKETTMANEPARAAGPGYIAPIVIIVAAAWMAAALTGAGGPLPIWARPVLAIGVVLAALSVYLYRHRAGWLQWSRRKRLYWVSMVLSLGFGAILGLSLQLSGVEMFSGDPLPSRVAVGLALAWLVGVVVASILYGRSVDDHERHAYQLASVAGFHFFLFVGPAWWILARAGLTPPAEAMPLILGGTITHLVVYLWYRFR